MTLYYHWEYFGVDDSKRVVPPTKYIYKIAASPNAEDARNCGIHLPEEQTKGRVFILRSETTLGPWRVVKHKNEDGTYQNTYEHFGSSIDAIVRIEELKSEYCRDVTEYVEAKSMEIRQKHVLETAKEIEELNDWLYKIENEDGRIID